MNKLFEEIKTSFYSPIMGRTFMEETGADFPSFVLTTQDYYGVAIPIDNDLIIKEKFANFFFETRLLEISGDVEQVYLTLTTRAFEYKDEFAHICYTFIDPGFNGENRLEILNNPLSWWEKWKELVGNRAYQENPYILLGELLTLLKLKIEEYLNIQWLDEDNASHDLESENEHFEVKTTQSKTKTQITISSLYQLQHDKPLSIIFYRFEKSTEGFSINDVVDILNKLEYSHLETKLSSVGYPKGKTSRNIKYRVLETRKYIVDDRFPILKIDDIQNKNVKTHLKNLSYTIDLTGIEFENWNINLEDIGV